MKRPYIFSLIVFILSLDAYSQRTITGTVYDEKGEPLIGATIQEVGTGNGTISEINGTYSLDILINDATLQFSYAGYASSQIKVEASNNVDVALTSSALDLEEVVVVGYGTQFRSDITGNVSSVKGDVIASTPVTSLQSALQGRAAGVLITKQNGKTGQGINVRIRGLATINGNGHPLYVIDGFVSYRTMYELNYNDVESVEILKDASAAAIYGSRASNGVVLITTKKGKSGKPQFSLDISTGFSDPTRRRKWLNAEQYLELWDEAFYNVADNNGLVFGGNADWWKNTFIPEWDGGHDTDWESEAFNDDAGMTQVQLGVSGGGGKTKYYISGGVLKQQGILLNDHFERISGRVNLSHDASERIKLGLNMSFSRTVNDLVSDDGAFPSPLSMIAIPPVQPVFDPQNPSEPFHNTVYFNGKLYEKHTSTINTVYRQLGNAYLKWSLLKNLTFHTGFGLDFYTNNYDAFRGSQVSEHTGEPGGFGASEFGHHLNYSTENYFSYSTTWKNTAMDFTAGMSYQESSSATNGVYGHNFPNDDFQNLASAGEILGGNESESTRSILSYFGRSNFNFDGKYLLSLSGRMDGDSRFGKNNQYGFFPAASAGWVLSKEKFLQDNRLLSYLKIRSSYGVTGNVPGFYFHARGAYAGTRYAGMPGIAQTRLGNPDLRWEKTTQTNLGIDFGLLDDRISGQVDYYVKNTDDLLLIVNIPETSGFSSQMKNVGELENKGFEVMLSSHNLQGKFKWKTSVNFAKNNNKVINIDSQIIDGAFVSRVVEGSPIGVFYIPEYAGVDPDNGDALYYVNATAGDRSTTNNINEAERIIVGNPHPDFIYGITNDFSYKGIELSVLLQGVYGANIYNAGGIWQMDGFGWFDNQDARMLDRWQKPGDQTDIPQLRFLGSTPYSSRFVEDGTYLRLKNLTLAYHLPKSLLAKIRLSSLKMYISAQNLLTITDYGGWDPEVNADGSANNINHGIDFYSAPQAKTVVFGVKVGL